MRAALWSLAKANLWLVSLASEADPDSCFWRLHSMVLEFQVQKRSPKVAWVIVSPYTFQWIKSHQSVAIKRAVEMFFNFPPEAVSVVGLLWAGVDNKWNWPARRVQRQYWKLAYTAYPTGYARRLLRGPDHGQCYGGDTVSGTRIYRTEVLSSLLDGVKATANPAWLINLDLEALKQGHGPRTFTCAFTVLREEDYKVNAKLTDYVAKRYEVEAAQFHTGASLQVNCQHTPDDLRYFRIMHGQGLVAPWCFRYILRTAWQQLASCWHAASPEHFLVPVDGTALALFRNPQHILPWDHDVDFLLAVNGPETFDPSLFLEPDSKEEAGVLYEFRKLGFSWTVLGDYRAKGAGMHLEVTYTSAVFAPGPRSVTLDAVVRPNYDRATWPLTAELAGVEVRMSADLVDFVVGKFKGSSDKRLQPGTFWGVVRDSESLTCREPGHTACLPDCTLQEPENLCRNSPECATSEDHSDKPWCAACLAVPTASCEFPDRFVEIDFFG